MLRQFELVSVDDRLPSPFIKVITRSSYGHLGIAFWDGRDWIDATNMETLGGTRKFLCFTWSTRAVTHWLDLD